MTPKVRGIRGPNIGANTANRSPTRGFPKVDIRFFDLRTDLTNRYSSSNGHISCARIPARIGQADEKSTQTAFLTQVTLRRRGEPAARPEQARLVPGQLP